MYSRLGISRFARVALMCGIAALSANAQRRWQTTNVVINIDTTHPTGFAAGFSGLNAPQLRNAAEYTDPNLLQMVTAMKPGWIRFPAGTADDAYNWATGNLNSSWVSQFSSIPSASSILNPSLPLTQAKGGVWLSDFTNFVKSMGATGYVCVNGFTDTAASAQSLAQSSLSYGLNTAIWELSNEAFLFPPAFFANAGDFASKMQPYAQGITTAIPNAAVALPFAGTYIGTTTSYTAWDSALASYAPRYWKAASVHVYPMTSSTLTTSQTQAFLNGILAHATADYINSYFVPLIGNMPIYITEFNSTSNRSLVFQTYLYNGIFLVEYIARMSAVPSVKGVGVHAMYMGMSYLSGMIQASKNDYEGYLMNTVYPSSVNTAGWPFGFYKTAPALALQVANQAINNSTQYWPTTVSGGGTVPISGFDGNPIPAIYAQAYQGNNGKRYLLITNKSASSQTAAVTLAGTLYAGPYATYSVSNTDPTANNNASNTTAVQIATGSAGTVFTIPAYSVMRVEF